jgi:hypothetical protein
MATPTQTQFQTGLRGAIGCDFVRAGNHLFLIEFDDGRLSSLAVQPRLPSARGLAPQGRRGVHTYLIELTGNLGRVPLASANRSAATVAATSMTAPLIGNATSRRVDSHKTT